MAETRIGISGWTYPPWRGVFFPEKLPHHGELEFASRRFSTIEINGTFYALQTPLSYKRWYRATPDDFVFSVKGPRYISHIKRLNDVESPLANFFASGILALGEKLGPILWQFPPSLKYDAGRFAAFVDLLPPDTAAAAKLGRKHDEWLKGRTYLPSSPGAPRPLRHTIEVRNESFHDRNFFELLQSKNIALVISHSGNSTGSWPMFTELTADFLYLRLHGEGEVYSGGYGKRALHQWAENIRRWRLASPKPRDVFLYFDNTTKIRAPFDALEFKQLMAEPQVEAGSP